MNWFKFFGQDWMTDLKIMRLIPEDRLCYITLLCLASTSENPGTIKKCDEEAILQLTHLYDNPYETDNEYNRAKGCLGRFMEKGMITISENGDVIVNNFLKRQETYMTEYERLKKHREKQKELKYGDKYDYSNDDNADNDNDNARIEENRIEENKNKREQKCSPTPKETTIKFFEMVKNKDKEYEGLVNKILENSKLDQEVIKRELNKFTNYWTELNQSGKKQRWEKEKTFEVGRRFSTWLSNMEKWSQKKFINKNTPNFVI